MAMRKSDLPNKICAACHRPFSWRKKWARLDNALLLATLQTRRCQRNGSPPCLSLFCCWVTSFPDISSLKAAPNAPVLMAELADEANYVRHHKQKIVLVFAAMRHFAQQLAEKGRETIYHQYDAQAAIRSFADAVAAEIDWRGVTQLFVTEPGEYRLLAEMRQWAARFGIEVDILPDTRFIASHADFDEWAQGRKQLRMEYFYRDMRRRTGILMEGDDPLGGQWNYDSDNRKKLPRNHIVPMRPGCPPDGMTREVMELVATEFANHPGTLDNFAWPVTHAQAEAQLNHFLDFCLPLFGDYQDAMKSGEVFLYHGLVGASINLGLLDPLKVCRAAEHRYHDGQARSMRLRVSSGKSLAGANLFAVFTG